jgi:hypothetical protein
METRATHTATAGSDYLPLAKAKARIKQAFLGGAVMTSKAGNYIGHTVDFRKCVSRLRREGLNIRDRWEANPDDGRKFKVYYLDGE